MASNAENFFIWWRHHVENYIFKINATSPIGQWVNSSPPSAAYVCISELGQCWFRWWLVACSVPSHHLHQPYLIVNGPLGTNFSEIRTEVQNVSLMKMYLKMSPGKLAAILSRGRWVNAKQQKHPWILFTAVNADDYYKVSNQFISEAANTLKPMFLMISVLFVSPWNHASRGKLWIKTGK